MSTFCLSTLLASEPQNPVQKVQDSFLFSPQEHSSDIQDVKLEDHGINNEVVLYKQILSLFSFETNDVNLAVLTDFSKSLDGAKWSSLFNSKLDILAKLEFTDIVNSVVAINNPPSCSSMHSDDTQGKNVGLFNFIISSYDKMQLSSLPLSMIKCSYF